MLPHSQQRKNSQLFLLLLAASVGFGWKTLVTLVQYSLSHEEASHVIVIPVLSAYLLWSERERIFGAAKPSSKVPGLCLIATGIVAYSATRWFLSGAPATDGFSIQMFSLIAIWIGSFLVAYGTAAAKAASFPLLLLLLTIPLPEVILSRVVYALEKGSTDITYGIFKALGVPTLRQGFYLTVPGITIEVAPECSGIRSSVAMLITCLLAAHYYLRTWWGALLFMFLVVPVSMIKNGIRIATLTLLSLYVDPSFLRGSLHRDGGFVFFFIGLAILGAALVGIRRMERRLSKNTPGSIGSLAPRFAAH
jgi:exosortase